MPLRLAGRIRAATSPNRIAASGVRRLVAVECPTPFRPQCARSLWVAFVEEPGRRHPVGPKAPEALAQFAPGDQVADRLHIAHRHGPDDALALAALFVAIKQLDFPARMNLRPYQRHVEAIGREVSRWRRFGHRLEYKGPTPFRHDGADLGDQILGRPRQLRIAVTCPPL